MIGFDMFVHASAGYDVPRSVTGGCSDREGSAAVADVLWRQCLGLRTPAPLLRRPNWWRTIRAILLIKAFLPSRGGRSFPRHVQENRGAVAFRHVRNGSRPEGSAARTS